MHLALTGGIGCGKSTALKIFHDLGAKTFDCDDVVHQLYTQQSVLDVLIERWGPETVRDGELNRVFIADIIFRDSSERNWLNEFIHPLVRQEINKNLSKETLNVSAVPLLYERDMANAYDYVIAIWSSPQHQLQRLKNRSWDTEEINRRVNSQISSDEKLERADFGLINDSDLKNLKDQCRMLWQKLNQN